MIKSMKKTLVGLLGMFFVPGVTLAANDVQGFLLDSLSFLNSTVVPFLFALAFLFFVVNVARYFIIGGDKEDERKKARLLALWGIVAFVIMVSIWGIVNLVVDGLGIDFQAQQPPCPDYLSVAACIELQGQEAQWDPF